MWRFKGRIGQEKRTILLSTMEEIKQACCEKCVGDAPLLQCRNRVCSICHKYDAMEANRKLEAETQEIINEHDPAKNPSAISLIRQKDGNWRGWGQRNGKMVAIRDINPETVLGLILTHE